MNKRILSLALPNIITNITVPLLGLVDTAIVGHLDTQGSNLDYIGAIAVGTMIINFIYWNFGFLRMGTSGFTAQSYGKRDLKESMNILTRALLIALIISFFLILLQYPIALAAKHFIENKNQVLDLAIRYFLIVVWAAPATLGMYAIKGWLIGMQDSKTPMYIAILINVMNIILSLFFVFQLNMKIEGVALGTVISQYIGLIAVIFIWFARYSKLKKYFNLKASLDIIKMKEFFKVNSDIFLRTTCLILVTTYFTIASSKMEYPILAVNAILMQLFTLFSYFMDGFAYASESLCGRYYGAKDQNNLKKSVKYILIWGLGISIVFMILYFFFGHNLIGLLTNQKHVLEATKPYMVWVLLIPLTGFVAFLYDGILIGMTKTVIMRNAIFIATASFFILYLLLEPMLGNTALWISFITYLLGRSVFMAILSHKTIFGKSNESRTR
ncbi:MAG TPA: MATE family efflux transporter [Bacteroidales bacterium]|nr:MATE family efflux transporter [Bacteroidales bacterium]